MNIWDWKVSVIWSIKYGLNSFETKETVEKASQFCSLHHDRGLIQYEDVILPALEIPLWIITYTGTGILASLYWIIRACE